MKSTENTQNTINIGLLANEIELATTDTLPDILKKLDKISREIFTDSDEAFPIFYAAINLPAITSTYIEVIDNNSDPYYIVQDKTILQTEKEERSLVQNSIIEKVIEKGFDINYILPLCEKDAHNCKIMCKDRHKITFLNFVASQGLIEPKTLITLIAAGGKYSFSKFGGTLGSKYFMEKTYEESQDYTSNQILKGAKSEQLVKAINDTNIFPTPLGKIIAEYSSSNIGIKRVQKFFIDFSKLYGLISDKPYSGCFPYAYLISNNLAEQILNKAKELDDANNSNNYLNQETESASILGEGNQIDVTE